MFSIYDFISRKSGYIADINVDWLKIKKHTSSTSLQLMRVGRLFWYITRIFIGNLIPKISEKEQRKVEKYAFWGYHMKRNQKYWTEN